MRRPHRAALLLLVLLSGAAAAAPTQEPAGWARALDEAVRAELQGEAHAGLSVAVSMGGFSWSAAYGLRELRRRLPAEVDTTYRFASITKSFTAIAVLQLVEQGKLTLDQELRTLVPAYPEKRWPITVRQLLGHLGGVPHYANAADGRNVEQVSTARAIELFADKPLAAEPGTEFVYTTWGYNLLGAAVEAASGEAYGSYLRRHLFEPAGMKTAAVDAFDTRGPEHAVGYRRRRGQLVFAEHLDVSSRFAGGGTRGSVLDLIAFGRAVLEHRLVSAASTAQMQAVMRTRDGRLTDYGMGFAVYPQHGHYVVAHAGGQPETTALLTLLPADRLVIAFAANLEGEIDLFRRIQTRFLELLLEDGQVRREAWAQDPVDRAQYEVMSRVFTYGLAYLRWQQVAGVEGAGASPEEAFARIRALLDRDRIAADVPAHRERLRAAHEPRGGGAVIEAGVQMARTLGRWGEADALRSYARRGPLAFFADYGRACEALQCPEALRFALLAPDLARLQEAWRKADAPELARVRLQDVQDPVAAWRKLQARRAGASFGPDYSEELYRLAERARRGGKAKAERAWLLRASRLHPGAVEPLLALADAEARDGEEASALRRYRAAQKTDPTAEALEPRALLARAGRTEDRRAARTVLAAATALHPDAPELWRALARAERALRRRKAEATALATAERLEQAAVPAAEQPQPGAPSTSDPAPAAAAEQP